MKFLLSWLALLGTALPALATYPYANLGDAEVVTTIRERLLRDATLSDLGKQVNIELDGSSVVLKGPVMNGYELTRILGVAKQVAGDRGVSENLTMIAE